MRMQWSVVQLGSVCREPVSMVWDDSGVKGAWLSIQTPVTGWIPTLRLEFSVQEVYSGVVWICTCGKRDAGKLSCDVGLIAALGSPTGPLELKWPIRVI